MAAFRPMLRGRRCVPPKVGMIPMLISALQKVAVSPKLAGAHDEVPRLAEEQLEVGKRVVETGKTRVRRFVTECEVSAGVSLREEHADVIRRAITEPKYIGEIDRAEATIEVVETAEHALVGKTARVIEEVSLKKIGSDQSRRYTKRSVASRSRSSA